MSRRRAGALAIGRWVRGVALLGVVAFGMPGVEGQDPAGELRELAAAQQRALDGGDRETIVEASAHLAAAAERVEAALLMADAKPGEAAELLGRSVALHRDPAAEFFLVQCAAAAHRVAEARAAAQRVSESRPDAPTHMALANAFHTGGDLPDTIAEIERAVALQPNDSAIHLALGSAFWELNEYGYNAESLREFGEAQRLAPGDFFSNYQLGAVLSEYRRYGEAERYLRVAAQADAASPDPWLQMGANAFAEGRNDAAREALETAVRLTGEDRARNNYQVRRAFVMLSRIAASAGHEEEATRYQVQAAGLLQEMGLTGTTAPLTESTAVPVAAVRPAAATVRAGDGTHKALGDDAAQRATAIIQLRGVAARSLNDAGTALAQERDYARALPFFREAAASDPTVVPVMRNLGLAAYHQAEYAEAVAALRKALEQTPGDTLVERYLEEARQAAVTRSPQ